MRERELLIVSRAKADRIGRFVVGSLLLLPALLTFGFACWFPALRTLGLSLQAAALGRPARFAGLSNYAYLWRDPAVGPALARSLLVAALRALAVSTLPVLVGRLWSRQGPGLRLLARGALSLGLALSAPAGLALLWCLAVPRTPWLRWLATGDGSRDLLAYLGLEFVSFLGVGGALTALTLLHCRPWSGRLGRGVIALAALAAFASGLDTFSLPFVMARLGQQQVVTLSLQVFRTAFQRLQLGLAAAEASPLLLLSLGLGLAFALLEERFELRLAPAGAEYRSGRSWAAALAGVAALALLLLPVVLLYLWGAGQAFLFPGRPLARAASVLQVELALVNGNLAPILAILLLQLPAAYLAALSLTLVRPFGQLGSRLAFAGLVASGFVPSAVVAVGLFDVVQRVGLSNTLMASGLPLVANPASLVIFRLYFAGQAPRIEQARRTGRPALAAFFQQVFRPSLGVAALAGAASFLLAGQSLLWPLLTLARSDLYPLSLRLVVHQAQLAGAPAALAAGAWLVLTCWGLATLLVWWLLQALVLERLRLEVEVSPRSPSATESTLPAAPGSSPGRRSPATGGRSPGRRRGCRSASHP